MVSVLGISLKAGLLLILIVGTFTGVALGRGVATGGKAAEQLRDDGDEIGALEVEDHEVGPIKKDVDGPHDHDYAQLPNVIKVKRGYEVNFVAENALNINGKSRGPLTVGDNTEAAPTSNNTVSVPSSNSKLMPPSIPSKNSTSESSLSTNTTNSSITQDANTGDETKAPPTHGGTCNAKDGPLVVNMAASGGDGEDGNHDYTLTVENGGGKPQLDVSIKASTGLKANPTKLHLTKGHPLPVTISVVDKEAAKLGARINISWGEGDCHLEIPSDNIGGNTAHPSYLAILIAPGPFILVLGGTLVFVIILAIVVVWGCITWRAQVQRHGGAETKYQELEMTLPTAVTKQDDGTSPSVDGWDEVWEDDDWQDTEAFRSSSTSLTLSSKGLNSRRSNKDGWDSSWDD